MKDFIKNKFITSLVVTATIILAGVAIFTALRLYQLRKESVSLTAPESKPSAWDCKNYVFSLDCNGVVTVKNDSSRNEPQQQAKVYINNHLVATLDVPALTKGTSANIGTVNIPRGESFNWSIVGTKDCSNRGTLTCQHISCEILKFTITQESPTPTPTLTPTPTVTVTPTVTPTLTPTPTLTVTPSLTPTLTPTPEPSITPTPTPTQPPQTETSTPTPTRTEIAANSPTPGGATLPDSGVGSVTIFGFVLGLFVIALAITLAL